jgi:LysM repeat protein
MKFRTLPVKRRPVSKGIFRRLQANTRNRKQRVAAAGTAAVPEMEEEEDHSSRISRALTIIFLIHIVAIALIFIHHRFLDDRAPEQEISSLTTTTATPASDAQRRESLPRLSTGDTPYFVQTGDNYARIAAAFQVDENDLREANNHVNIGPGQLLSIPPKRIVAEEPPEVAAIRANSHNNSESGLVEAVDISGAPRAILIRPNNSSPSAPATHGKTHVVQSGESIFRISSRYKVSQEALMRANGITDPRKMRVGSRLVIPES